MQPGTSWNEKTRQAEIARIENTFNHRDHALALRNLSKVLTWAGKFDDADRLALDAVSQLPDDFEAHFLAGNAELRRGNSQEAISHFETTVKLNPNHVTALNNLGDQYFQLGNLELAAKYFQQSVSVDSRFAMGIHNLGVVKMELGELAAAEELFSQALAIEPDRFDSHTMLSKLYFQQQRYQEATHHMERAVEIRPDAEAARADLQMLKQMVQ